MDVYSFLEEAIRRQVRRYLAGDMSLNEFSDWFVGETWDVERTSPEETQQLVYKIDNALIRYSEDLINLGELRDIFGSCIEEEFTETFSSSLSEQIDRTNDFYPVQSPSCSGSEVVLV